MTMNEAVLILPNMRGGCATVGTTVHTLFRVTSRRPRAMAKPRASKPEPISLHCSEQAERTSES
jgi:hypothetical protein